MMTRVNKVAAIIISYNDAAAVLVCVRALKAQVGLIIVVDNGSNTEHISKLRVLDEDPIVSLIESPVNLGIGAAVNLALRTLDIAGVDWILTMDQDSVPAPDMVQKMLKHARFYPNAAFTPETRNVGAFEDDLKPVQVSYAITSGNLIPFNALCILNGFNPHLFIDGVDFDFSLRLRSAGYRIFRVPEARMSHALGSAIHGRRPKRFHTNHSPLRRYYIARNAVLNLRRHGRRFPFFFIQLFTVLTVTLLNMLIWGPKRKESLAMVFRGFRDGVCNRSGAFLLD